MVLESTFCDRPVHKDGFPMQLRMLMQERFFWTGLVPYGRSVNEISESRYGFLIEFYVFLLVIMYLVNTSLLFTTIFIPWYSLNSDVIKSIAASKYSPFACKLILRNSSIYF